MKLLYGCVLACLLASCATTTPPPAAQHRDTQEAVAPVVREEVEDAAGLGVEELFQCAVFSNC